MTAYLHGHTESTQLELCKDAGVQFVFRIVPGGRRAHVRFQRSTVGIILQSNLLSLLGTLGDT